MRHSSYPPRFVPPYLSSQSTEGCPPDLHEAVCTLLYCEHRTEAAELEVIAKQLTYKYGAEFAALAASNTGGCVNERVVHKLSVQPPSSYLVQQVATT